MKIKFGNHKSYSYPQILKEQKAGGRFVVYQWIIPLPFFTPVRRLSKVYFIGNTFKKSKYCGKYNVLNLLLGWWGLPFGPIVMIQSVILNLKGGVDVSEDVLLNINETDYEKGFVQIREKAVKYMRPSKTEIKEFSKVFKKLDKKQIIDHSPIVGCFIDTEKDEKPFYVIGIRGTITGEIEEAFEKEVYKRFYRSMDFKLVNVNEEFETKHAFIKQGLEIECC